MFLFFYFFRLVGFFQLKDFGGKNKGIPMIIQIFSAFMLLGLVVTVLVPETKGKTLEQLNGEDEEAAKLEEEEYKKKSLIKNLLQ